MKKLRGAIVGFGNVAAQAHVPGYAATKGFEVVAVVDAAPERREAAGTALPAAKTFESLEELVASGTKVDFVDLATTPRFHAKLAGEALRAGLHVLCEKPLACRSEELDDLLSLAAPARRALFTVHNWKYAPLIRRLHGVLFSGTIGEPTEIEWSVLRPSPPAGATAGTESWRTDPELAGGGIVLDHGWHAFYLMLYLTGWIPRSVTAVLRRERDLAVEDNAEVTIDFGGCTARVHLSWTAAERKTRGRLQGPHGSIEVDDASITVRAGGREPEITRFAPPLSASSYHPEWFPPLLEDFRGEVLHPGSRGGNLVEAERCARMVFAAYASNGAAVALPVPEESDGWVST